MKKTILNIIRKIAGTAKLQKDVTKLRTAVSDFRYEVRKNQLIEHILHDTESGVTSHRYTDHDIIVSLTTYGKRIHDVAFTIESIMQQSMKPNKIVLWLDYSFQNQQLPQSLINQQKRGLEIFYCEDMRSYKKIIPSLLQYPNDAIITIDDDVLYDYDLLEHLIVAYLHSPTTIHSCRMHQMRFDENGVLLPYNRWNLLCPELGASNLNFATGVGGILYPPHCFDDEVLNKSAFMGICKFADDVWLKAMALRNGILVNKVYTRSPLGEDFILNDSVQDIALRNINIMADCLNDSQLKAVFAKYNLFDKLR